MSLLERYQEQLHCTGFYPDAAQAVAVEALQSLHTRLLPANSATPAIFLRIFGRVEPVTGIYIQGGVGRGKTWLMDLFYESLQTIPRQRVHYHKFMFDIHEQLKYLPKSPDPLVTIGKQIASQTRVLCLDEFHVTDVTDAMLLAGLLHALFSNNVTLVATSNTCIDELYKNGLQRERFMDAIALLKKYTQEIRLAEGKDYRLVHLEQADTYLVTNGESRQAWLEQRFSTLAPSRVSFDVEVIVYDRPIRARAISDDVIWFDFNEICNTPRAAKDYLYLSREYHTVIISSIPVRRSVSCILLMRCMIIV
jgi:cell division protein ZapE